MSESSTACARPSGVLTRVFVIRVMSLERADMLRSRRSGMLLSLLLLIAISPTAHGQDSLLRIEIRMPQASIKNGHDVEVSTKIINTGSDDLVLHLSQCSYSTL